LSEIRELKAMVSNLSRPPSKRRPTGFFEETDLVRLLADIPYDETPMVTALARLGGKIRKKKTSEESKE